VRFLGVDLGGTRTGLALSDAEAVTCSPLPPIVERDREKTLLKVASVVEEERVRCVVVGLPRPLAGGSNTQVEEVLGFVERLRALVEVPVLTWDERFTSKLAESGVRRRGAADSVAACYLLQNYLDSLRHLDSLRLGPGEEEVR
jgi:putative Holliday junction resolvase